jgi:ATPase subunit of ABC transporter with duplicated ATPase domains
VISFSKISKQYGRQILFVDASFQLNPGEKVGLVGPNGSGKTTLFRMIVGEETPDEGDVSVPKRLTIGYFRQDVEEMSGRSVIDEAILGSGRVGDLHHELEQLNHAMSDPARADDLDRILRRFGEVQEEYDHLGGYALEAQAREVLLGLGFDDEQIDGDVGALSGGWKMRVAMGRVLLGRPDVLLMDEPTNHLDIESIIWLESFLTSLPGALLMTSHDREFMNRIVTKIAEIDGGEITSYTGNYDFYERERAIRETNREAAYARQQAMLAKEQRFIERFAAHAAKAAQVQSRVKALEKIEKIELPKKRRVVKFDFRTPPRSGEQVAVLEGVTKKYGRRVVHDGLNLIVRRGERWCVMGKNGAGKSTLLKMVVGQVAPDAGEVRLGASLALGYFAQQSLDLLDPDLTIEEQLRKDFPEESIGALRSLAGAFQFSGEDTDKKVRALSGGEKTRLVLARMLLNPPNFLVLDEPTNHLDLAAREQLENVLADFGGTLLFVSHDRYFIDKLASEIWLVDDGILRRWEGNWSSYQREKSAGRQPKVIEYTPANRIEIPGESRRDGGPSRAERDSRPVAPENGRPGAARAGKGPASTGGPAGPSGSSARNRRSSPVRRVNPTRALEARIEAMELQLKQLTEKVAQIAQSGNYLETRRIGEEHAELERSLKQLYEDWAKVSNDSQEPS